MISSRTFVDLYKNVNVKKRYLEPFSQSNTTKWWSNSVACTVTVRRHWFSKIKNYWYEIIPHDKVRIHWLMCPAHQRTYISIEKFQTGNGIDVASSKLMPVVGNLWLCLGWKIGERKRHQKCTNILRNISVIKYTFYKRKNQIKTKLSLT